MGRMPVQSGGPLPVVCQRELGGSPVMQSRHDGAGWVTLDRTAACAVWTADTPVHRYLQGWRALRCKAG